MTNNWADMANSTLFVAMGSNFVENHPAATAHVLRAHDLRPSAKLVVIDPRKTRTALLAEAHGGRFIRFRPGTDIAFNNAVAKEIIRIFEEADGIPTEVQDLYYDYLNQSQSLSLYRNDGTTENVSGNSLYTDARFRVNGQDYLRSSNTDPDGFLDLPLKAADIHESDTVYSRLVEHLAPYEPELVAQVCDCTADEIKWVARQYVENSRMMSSYLTGDPVVNGIQDPRDFDNYRATQMMYAMGLTQHTHGAQNVKGFTIIQILTGNVGRAGAAINALRGIHNVQGSTDMGVLQHLIPGYSGNPVESRTANVNAFGRYTDNLWGQPTRYPLDGGGNPTYDDAYGKPVGFTAPGGGLQARGFYNMTLNWFGSYAAIHDGTSFGDADRRTATDMCYDLWPKSQGDDHITMFRKMAAGEIKGCVVWGQNPAVTEPNQSAVRAGFENLDVLIVTDMFETETAAVDRKSTGVTYLFPACSHVEEAGSTANSGRVLQWRERAAKPKGNSKTDIELLMRFAYAIDKADGFSHILGKWNDIVANTGIAQWWDGSYAAPVFKELYADQHAGGWDPATEEFEDISGTTEMWYSLSDPVSPGYQVSAAVKGSELVTESIYRQCGIVPANGGTMWLYLDAYNDDRAQTARLHTGQAAWLCANRAKQREGADPNGTFAYPGWGYSWLVNRRVLYNNTDIPGDIADNFQTPDSVARLFVPTYTPAAGNHGAVGYANNRWRRVHGLADRPDNWNTSPIHTQGKPGRFPAHTEPYETPLEFKNPDLLEEFGRNTRGTGKWDLVHTDSWSSYTPTMVATNDADYPAAYRVDPTPNEDWTEGFPLVLTTIRSVEHFQGGPITRNNAWNVEMEPQPWIEINSVDANRLGIKSGDNVNVITARGRTDDQAALSPNSNPNFASEGFIARVGVGPESNQRVGVGVVAIPWHWGDKGLSAGARANDLCIDSFDANTRIPEYKACLCRIEKM